MEVCEANPRPRPLLVSRGSFFGSTLPSPHCRQISLQNKFRITLHLMRRNYSPHSSIICSSKARSSRDLHKVLWKIEADLADGQLLYITGDPIALGSWKPEMAVLMSPTEGTNLWMAEVKVPCGTNFRYSYFIREDKCSLYDLIWRPGPEFSVSVPLPSKQKERILVRDSWLTVPAEGLPVHSWDSWLEETCLTVEPVASATSGVTSDPYSIGKDDDVNFSYKLDAGETVSERYQPVEEPWLHQSSFFFLELNKLDMVVFDTTSDKNDSTSDKNDSTERFFSKNDHDEENLEDESRLACLEEPVSIDILINSSVCTMQRIAVLEDGKLVELLLEPVKNNVQCDSVYLGVISKLVPNMGGAFVNIGTSKPSLMGIKHYREPFAFPPFRSRSKRKKSNGSVLIEYKEDADANDCESASHDDADIIHVFADSDYQDSLVKLMNGDFEENEIEDDCDVEDASKQNLNGSIIDYGRDREGDSDDDAEDNERNLDNETFNGFLGSLDSQLVHDGPESVNACSKVSKWDHVRKGTKVIVQVVKEGLGSKGPMLSPYPHLRSRFWVLITRCERIGVSKKIPSVERTRLRLIAKTLQPPGFGLTVRTVAAGHSLEELQKDLEGLLLTWNNIVEHAKSVALAADEGVEGAMPVILHQAMGKTLSVAQDYFNDKVKSMVVDSPRTYHEITSYLHEIAPDLCDRVDLYDKRTPIFDEYGIEEEINNMLSKRVPLLNGGSLVIEQTEALVSIDVNGGHGMLAQGNSQQKAILEVNLAAAKQIARELRLRDIGGIIVVDFIDMVEDMNKRLVYEEVKRSAARDRSSVRVSELSRHGLMEITRKRVRPSVTYMISEPCICCHATGRVEALATSFSKIEHEICRLLASTNQKEDSENPKSWPKFSLWVDRHMCNYLTSGKKTKLALLSSSLKVWLILKVARGFSRGEFEVKPFTDNKENNDENEAATSRSKPTEDRSHMPTSKLKLFPMKKWKTSRK